jgi:hypothetical protein
MQILFIKVGLRVLALSHSSAWLRYDDACQDTLDRSRSGVALRSDGTAPNSGSSNPRDSEDEAT